MLDHPLSPRDRVWWSAEDMLRTLPIERFPRVEVGRAGMTFSLPCAMSVFSTIWAGMFPPAEGRPQASTVSPAEVRQAPCAAGQAPP